MFCHPCPPVLYMQILKWRLCQPAIPPTSHVTIYLSCLGECICIGVSFFFFFFLANCSFNTGSSLSTLIRRVRWDEAVAGSASITCSLSHPAPLFSRHRPWKQHTFLFTIVWFNRSPGVIHVKQTSGSKHALRQNLEFNQTLLSETCHILAVSGRQFRKTQLGNYPQNQNRNKEESP